MLKNLLARAANEPNSWGECLDTIQKISAEAEAAHVSLKVCELYLALQKLKGYAQIPMDKLVEQACFELIEYHKERVRKYAEWGGTP